MAQNLSNLPMELLTDILSRLPPKSLLRFRCVSKPWCSLIDSPHFINFHLKQSEKTKSNRSVILEGLGVYKVDMDTPDHFIAVELDPPVKFFEISNSINGLFLVMSDDSPLIWNPSTHKLLPVPSSSIEYPQGSLPGSAYETYGFGYDSHNADYKVVKSVKCKGYDYNWMNCETKVYSVKFNAWKRIDDFSYPLPHRRIWGIHVNDALHCHFVSPELIMAFNVGTETHHAVPNPNFSGMEKSDISTLAEIGGCLSFVNPSKKFEIDVWVMKEYGVEKSWTRLFSVAPPLIPPNEIVFPLGYSKCGLEVLLNLGGTRLIWYNLEKKAVRNVQVHNMPFVFHAETFVGSLVNIGGADGCGVSAAAREGEDAVKEHNQKEKPKPKTTTKKRDDFLSQGFKLVL